jgi:hypothetical protein
MPVTYLGRTQPQTFRRRNMDGQTCDRHPRAAAKARILFPNLCTLYLCQHCANHFSLDYAGEFHITYEAVTV